MFKLPYVICIIWESSVKCKVLFKGDCIYQCRISARNQLCFIPGPSTNSNPPYFVRKNCGISAQPQYTSTPTQVISRSGSSNSIFHELLMIPWFHYLSAYVKMIKSQNSQLRIFYLQGSIYVPKIKVKQLFCGLGNLNRLLNEGSSPHPTTLESAFTSERKSRSNFQARSKACLVPVSCDTSTLHPSKCEWYVGSHRCLGRWQAPVSLAPSSKVQNHKWWNATKHCLQGHFSSIFPTLRVPEINELEISKNCSSIFLLRSSASLASLFLTWKDTELSRTWVAGPIQQNHHFPGRFSQSTLANHQRFERPPNAEGKCQLRLKNRTKQIKTSYRDDINFEDTTVTCVLCINQDLKNITVSSLVNWSHQNPLRGGLGFHTCRESQMTPAVASLHRTWA